MQLICTLIYRSWLIAGKRIAGDELHIHHNTFLNAAGTDPSVANSPDAFVRGTPRTLAHFTTTAS